MPDRTDAHNSLQNVENLLAEFGQQVRELRDEVTRLKATHRPRMPWNLWLRHQVKVLLGLEVHVGRLAFRGPPRPLVIPSRYYRKPSLTNPPVISIVTPSFNQGAYLEKTIASVFSQEYPRLEFVVQDGGSTDETADVLARFRDKLHYCEMRKDNGQAHAINLGFAHTSGEIMAYLNSDDLLLPGAMHAVAAYFTAHSDVDVVYGHRVLIDRHGDETGRWVLPPHDDAALKWLDVVPQETLFWRRRIWDKVGGIDEQFRFAMDWDLLLRFQAAGAKFHRLGRFLGAFRVHDASKTMTISDSAGATEAARLYRRTFGRDVTPQEVQRGLRRYCRRHVACNRLYTLGLFRY
jgi:carbamoyltransferase